MNKEKDMENKNRKGSLADRIPHQVWLLISFAAAMALWTLLSVIPATSRAFPNVFKVLGSIKTMIDRGVLWKDISSSLISVISGYALGFVIALPVAILMAWYKPVRFVIEPWIQFIRNIPPLAYVPLIVIAAGYTELMGRFLHANPGLESRFNKYFYFEDYNGAQLLAIFQSMCAKNGYTLDDKATEYAESYFKTLYEERDENFGNARDVRNVFERAVARQSDRVAALEKPGKEELMALTVADLQEEGGPVPDGAPDETLPESP